VDITHFGHEYQKMGQTILSGMHIKMRVKYKYPRTNSWGFRM